MDRSYVIRTEHNTELWDREMNEEYLAETKTIDYGNPIIREKVSELKADTSTTIEYIEKAYKYVRDKIPHSWDVQSTVISRKASEVLENKTGICWTKSCLLAALLRANGIPSGISYQLLTRADEDDSEGYIIHALNTVYLEEQNKWIRLDARGNKENVHAEFNTEEEHLAFPIRSEFGEIDYKDNNADLDERLVSILNNSRNILEVTTDLEMDHE